MFTSLCCCFDGALYPLSGADTCRCLSKAINNVKPLDMGPSMAIGDFPVGIGLFDICTLIRTMMADLSGTDMSRWVCPGSYLFQSETEDVAEQQRR